MTLIQKIKFLLGRTATTAAALAIFEKVKKDLEKTITEQAEVAGLYKRSAQKLRKQAAAEDQKAHLANAEVQKANEALKGLRKVF